MANINYSLLTIIGLALSAVYLGIRLKNVKKDNAELAINFLKLEEEM